MRYTGGMPVRRLYFIAAFSMFLFAAAEGVRGEGIFEERDLRTLDRALLSKKGAQLVSSAEWRLARSPHFWIYFQDRGEAFAVAREAEFYYRVFVEQLNGGLFPEAGSNGAGRIFLFDAERWQGVVEALDVEEWSGALTRGEEIFLPRNAKRRFKGNALGHEIGHLSVRKFLGDRLPLWMEEGLVEELSDRAYAAFHRARGYRAKPVVFAVQEPMPLAELFSYRHYPPSEKIEPFYHQSRQLVRFIEANGSKETFSHLLKRTARGEGFMENLLDLYRAKWRSAQEFEQAWAKSLRAPRE